MQKHTVEFVEGLIKESTEFRKLLSSESDRGCALFGAAYLDKSLSDLLYVSLVEHKDIESEVLTGASSPLSTFSARIKISFYLGLISRVCRRDLDIIRSIRNDFAHKLNIHSFADQPACDRCRSLLFSYHEPAENPRAHFTAAVMAILAHVQASMLSTTPHAQRPDDAPGVEMKSKQRDRIQQILAELEAAPPKP